MARDPRKRAAKPVDNQVRQGRMKGPQTEAAPAGNRGLTTTVPAKEVIVMADSQPTLDPLDVRLDGCPRCLTRNNVAHEARADGEDGYVAAYQCFVCGRAWLTSWMAG